MEITNSEFSCQHQAKQNGEFALVEYSIQECKIFPTKILLLESADEVSVDEFSKGVLALVSQKEYKVVLVCPAAIAFFRRNKEYKEVLSAGIKI